MLKLVGLLMSAIICKKCGVNIPLIPDLYIVHPTIYGSEAWTRLQEDLRKLEAFYMRYQRMILEIR